MKKKMCMSGIGGQAVLEGIMMRNKDKYAVAVRKPDKTIDVKVTNHVPFIKGKKILSLPFIRGIFNFIDSMVVGIKTLTYSASFYEEDEEPSEFEKKLQEKFGDKLEKIIMTGTIIFSVALAVGLFMLLPLFISDIFANMSLGQIKVMFQ